MKRLRLLALFALVVVARAGSPIPVLIDQQTNRLLHPTTVICPQAFTTFSLSTNIATSTTPVTVSSLASNTYLAMSGSASTSQVMLRFQAIGVDRWYVGMNSTNSATVRDWSIYNAGTTKQSFRVDPTTDDVMATSGNLQTGTAGKTLAVKSGTNALAGTVTLSSGTATISSTAIDANTVIVLTLKTVSGTVGGQPYVDTITAGTSATLTGGGASNNSTYNWVALKVNP